MKRLSVVAGSLAAFLGACDFEQALYTYCVDPHSGCAVDGGYLIATGQPAVYNVAVGGGQIFWVTHLQSGGAYGMPIDGGALTALALNQASPYSVATDSAGVYWTQFVEATGAISRANFDGTASAALIQPVDSPCAVAVNGGYIYWSTKPGDGGSGIYRATVSSPTPIPIAQALGNICRFAVDGTNVYWPDRDASVFSAPVTGGSPVTVSNVPGSQPESVAVANGVLYWSSDVASGSIVALPLDGGMAVTLADLQAFPAEVVADGKAVYWANLGQDAGAIMRVDLVGGAPEELVGAPKAYGLTVDDVNVYWSVYDVLGNGAAGVYRIPKP